MGIPQKKMFPSVKMETSNHVQQAEQANIKKIKILNQIQCLGKTSNNWHYS